MAQSDRSLETTLSNLVKKIMLHFLKPNYRFYRYMYHFILKMQYHGEKAIIIFLGEIMRSVFNSKCLQPLADIYK